LSKRKSITVSQMGALVTEVEKLNEDLLVSHRLLRDLIQHAHNPRASSAAATRIHGATPALKLETITASIGCTMGRSDYTTAILENFEPEHPEVFRAAEFALMVTQVLDDEMSALKLVPLGPRAVHMRGLGASSRQGSGSRSKPAAPRMSFQVRRELELLTERLLNVGNEMLLATEGELEALLSGEFDDVPAALSYSAWMYAHTGFCHADMILEGLPTPMKRLAAELASADKAISVIRDTQWMRVAAVPVEPRSAALQPSGRPPLALLPFRRGSSR